ncbi:Mpp10 protein-domain-containing protein [Chytridium lagenaria]|nr:Mpp10 protein-domain-containing protein [Chytridium lagenaria]
MVSKKAQQLKKALTPKKKAPTPENPLSVLSDQILGKPELFLIPDEAVSQRLLSASKWMFDFGLRRDPSSQSNPSLAAKKFEPHGMSPLDKLHVEGFDLEQVWEQIQLQNIPMMEHLKGEMDKMFPEDGGDKTSRKRAFEDDEGKFEEDADLDEMEDEGLEMDEDVDGEEEEDMGDEEEEEDMGEDVKWTPLDDEFFSLAEMERFAEMGEAKDMKRETGKQDEVDEWSLGEGYLGLDPDELDGSDEEDEMNANAAAHGVKFNDKVQEKRFRKDDPASAEGIEDDDDDYGFIGDEDGSPKKKNQSIFDLEEDEDPETVGLSPFERQQAMLSKQIEDIEEEMIAEKPWALKGEVSSKARPLNSLLEENLEVEHASRPTPVVTEETTATLEDMIRSRIKDSLFDDVERKIPVKEKTFDPNRRDIIDENKSSKSLAEIYEGDYLSKNSKAPIKSARQEAVDAAHKEIDTLFTDLCTNLDALANYQYAPNAPRVELEIIAAPSVPALTVEEIIPASVADATLAAPEEVYEGGTYEEGEGGIKVGMTKEKALQDLMKQKNVTFVADSKRGKGSVAEAATMKGKGKKGKTIMANVVERGGKLGGDKKGKAKDGANVRVEFLRL